MSRIAIGFVRKGTSVCVFHLMWQHEVQNSSFKNIRRIGLLKVIKLSSQLKSLRKADPILQHFEICILSNFILDHILIQ
jgi:hypothetical protein